MDIESRLIEVETKVAFQDDTLQTLNDVVARQQFQLETLERQIQEMAALLKSSQSQIRELQQETPPPHY